MFLVAGMLAGCRGSTEPGGVEAASRSLRMRVGGFSLHATQVGPERGPVRLVVHGGPGLDQGYLRPWLDDLACDGARVVYVDLRGHGRSDPPPDASGYTLSAAAGDLATVARGLDEGRPVTVIAHDFGATVALELAAAHPERVRRLLLIDPLRDGAQLAAMGDRTRAVLGPAGQRAIAELSTPQGTLRDPRQLPALFRALGPLWWASPPTPALVDRLARDVRYRAEADEHFLLQLQRWDGLAVARQVRAETLVVSGAQDRTFTPEESRTIADTVAHGRFVAIEGAGHLPFVERRAAFVAAVRPFLRER